MNGRPCAVTVDLGAIEHGVVATHPVYLGIRVKLQQPSAEGLPKPSERPALDGLQQRLEAEVVAAADGLHVYRYFTAGYVHLGFYVLPRPLRDPNITDGYDPYSPELVIDPDLTWANLLEDLAPDPWQRQLIATGRIMAELRRLGDDPAAKRKVDHTIVLPAGVDPRGLISGLTELGYTIDTVHNEETEISINCSRVDDLTDPIARVGEVFDLAIDHGGLYDGWGAPITSL